MAYEQRNNSGTLGRNKNKEKESHPDHRGQAIVDGVEYWVSAWIKQNGTTGEKFFSLSFQPKDVQREPNATPQGGAPHGDFDDDVPFN